MYDFLHHDKMYRIFCGPGRRRAASHAGGRRACAPPAKCNHQSLCPFQFSCNFETADGVKVTVVNHRRNHVSKCSTQYVSVGTVYILDSSPSDRTNKQYTTLKEACFRRRRPPPRDSRRRSSSSSSSNASPGSATRNRHRGRRRGRRHRHHRRRCCCRAGRRRLAPPP